MTVNNYVVDLLDCFELFSIEGTLDTVFLPPVLELRNVMVVVRSMNSVSERARFGRECDNLIFVKHFK